MIVKFLLYNIKKNNIMHLCRYLCNRTFHTNDNEVITLDKKIEYYPLTHPQKGIWYTEKLYPGTSIGNLAATLKIKGDIDYTLLEKAIDILICRNDSTRLRFTEIDGIPYQYIFDYQQKKLDFFNFENDGLDSLYKWDENQTKTPFELLNSELFYFAMLKISKNEAGIFCKIHHLISDGWSLVHTGNKIIENYNLLKSGLTIDEKKDPSYIEYVFQEQEYLKSDKYVKDKKYWEEVFYTYPELTSIKSNTSNEVSISSVRKTFILPIKLSNKIRDFCKLNRTSVFGLFISTLCLYINRVTSKSDLIIGVPILNRSEARVKNMTGMFVSTVPLRIAIDDETNFLFFLQMITRELISTLRHQKLPYEDILRSVRDKHGNVEKLFDISLSYQNAKFIKTSIQERQEGRWHFNGHQTESLYIHINDREDDGNLILDFDFLKNLYSAKEVEFIYDHLIRLLWHALDNPQKKLSCIEMISEKEKNTILNEFNNTYIDFPSNKTIHKLLEEQAERTPNEIAIIFENEKMTYKVLNEKANQLASTLKQYGSKKDRIVGIMVHRSLEMIVSIFAVLKSGGAYLPIDPEYPESRIDFMLEDSEVDILLTETQHKNYISFKGIVIDVFDSTLYDQNISDFSSSDSSDLAYMIYTSGSTGKPKGVMIEHKAVVNLFKGICEKINFTRGKVILSITTMSFDIFVLETLLPVSRGMTVIIANEKQQKVPGEFIECVINNKVQMIQTTPSRMQLMMSDNRIDDCLDNLSEIMLGGESFPNALLDKLRSLTKAKIYNMYGPTETTVWSTVSDVTYSKKINLGKPIANTSIYILDKYKNLLPIGVAGDLYIGGIGLARGYYKNSHLTNERFIDNPFRVGEKIYKTGDIARWYPGGDIEYFGRSDFQIKIRGYRIELGEIENILLKHKDVDEVAVMDFTDKNGKMQLCAYVVVKKDILLQDLRSYIARELPAYMIPSYYMILDSMPKTNNDKVDRTKLAKPDMSNMLNCNYVAPENEIQAKMAGIWCKILGIEEVGIYDNFFELGGDSLGIVQLASWLQNNNYNIPAHDIYNYPTIKKISTLIDSNYSMRPVEIFYKDEKSFRKLNINKNHKYDLNKLRNLPTINAAAISYLPNNLEDTYLSEFGYEPLLFSHINSAIGNIGLFLIPLKGEFIYANKDELISQCLKAIKLSEKSGAKVVSLTGLIPSATNYGTDIVKECIQNNINMEITTGHATTSASVVLSVERLLLESNRKLENEKVCVLGLGSIGTSVIKLMLSILPHPESIILCEIHNRKEHVFQLIQELKETYGYRNRIECHFTSGSKLSESIYYSTLFIGATNAPNILNIDKLQPGTLIIDDSAPHCFNKDKIIKRLNNDKDVLFTEGGVLHSPTILHKTSYLPEFKNKSLIKKYKQYYEDNYEVTGCIFSSLLTMKFDLIKPSIGNITIDECIINYNILKELNFSAAHLHCEDYIIPNGLIRKFCNKVTLNTDNKTNEFKCIN